MPTAVLVAVARRRHGTRPIAVAEQLRARGIACEVAPAADKFGKQIRYADRRGIPYVWFGGLERARSRTCGPESKGRPIPGSLVAAGE